ncbi:MAG: efflux RND transporter permease subunit [Proteobacteria bacterium]|nr:efflux RND transporter permease subunit [Pseudomonadota bacterium]
MRQSSIYAQPLRVYVGLAFLALIGVFAGTKLPISLFPNSTKPVVQIWMNYGDSTAEEFIQLYGHDLESQVKTLSLENSTVSNVKATYDAGSAYFKVTFNWGDSPILAEREVWRIVDSWSTRLDESARRSVGVWLDNEDSGFFAATFYSEKRNLDELYQLLEPVYLNKIKQVKDASNPELWNPAAKEIKVELKLQALVSLQLSPADVGRAIEIALKSYDGGATFSGASSLRITLPKPMNSLEDLTKLPIATKSGRTVHLGDISTIDFGIKSSSNRIIKTSGSTSIMIYSTPKAGGNIKKMSEDLLQVIEEGKKILPSDVQFKVLVDPSQFIRSSIENVFHEVGIGSLLAVTILFIFIGSFKNVATAAIEIPLSLVLAFILMKLFNVNLNLISLGGLALSAGMNVDASVVVMENIFRHFEIHHGKKLSRDEKLNVVLKAVAEVRTPIISSTIASLVVFVPLLMTSDLSYAILGDLAKAVVFSHAFSAGVALLLVPTVRYHLMRDEEIVQPHVSKFEPQLAKLDRLYEGTLQYLLNNNRWRRSLYLSTLMLLPILVYFVLPKLPREVIGVPDTDMLVLRVNAKGNTKIRQMETISDEVEKRALDKFAKEIDYTFTQIGGPNRATIIPRLKDKRDMEKTIAAMEKEFTNTPQLKFGVSQFNPSELPIPDPPALKVAIRGGSPDIRRDTSVQVMDLLESSQVYARVTSEPNLEPQKGIFLKQNLDHWSVISSQLTVSEAMSMVRTATEGKWIGNLEISGQETGIFLRFPDNTLSSPESLDSMPIGLNNKIVPLKSIFEIKTKDVLPSVFRDNGDEVFNVFGSVQASQKKNSTAAKMEGIKLIQKWKDDVLLKDSSRQGVTVEVEDAASDVTDAIEQLGFAILGSVILIFIVLLLQFGSVVEPLLILLAVPLGFIGVLIALFVFGSTLSLNSALGVILLNGIAVNNSIILVDFTKRLWLEGREPVAAALHAARLRLRPILITSLTSIFGMMPIALGLGEGGKILQPLGIAVSGGLWISMLLTLLIVPLLQVQHLTHSKRLSV